MHKYVFRLYITGRTPASDAALSNLRRICELDLRAEYEIEVIDVLERPQLAEDEKILLTPTLVREHPLPTRRIVGDLSNRQMVLLGLDLRPLTPGQ